MKYILLLIFSLGVFHCYGQKVILPSEVGEHIGEIVTVHSKVYSIQSIDTVTILRLGSLSDTSALNIVFPTKYLNHFKDAPFKLATGRVVFVTGKVLEDRGKAGIVITSPWAIRLLNSVEQRQQLYYKQGAK